VEPSAPPPHESPPRAGAGAPAAARAAAETIWLDGRGGAPPPRGARALGPRRLLVRNEAAGVRALVIVQPDDAGDERSAARPGGRGRAGAGPKQRIDVAFRGTDNLSNILTGAVRRPLRPAHGRAGDACADLCKLPQTLTSGAPACPRDG
jgi:hypothetical protein